MFIILEKKLKLEILLFLIIFLNEMLLLKLLYIVILVYFLFDKLIFKILYLCYYEYGSFIFDMIII